MSGKQWNALRTALQWSRADRDIDIVELISGLGCTGVSQRMIAPQHLISAADTPRRGGTLARTMTIVALLLVAGALAYWRDQLPLPKLDFSALLPPLGKSTPPTHEAPLAETPGNAVRSEAVVLPPPIEKPAAIKPQASAAAPLPRLPTKEKERVEVPPMDALEQPQEPVKVAKQESRPQGVAGPAIVGFDKDTYVVQESEGSVKLTVRRTGNLRGAATFHWALLANSAEGGSDFAAIGPETERMPPGAATTSLTIPLVSDSIKENTELFLVELSLEEDGPQLGEVSRAAVIIVDDD